MLLIASLALVLGTVAVVLSNMLAASGELRFGWEQMIHARIPWLLLSALALGSALGIASIVRRRAWYKYPVVGVELLLSGLLTWYFVSLSFLPPHELRIDSGEPFPAYTLRDQDGRLHVVAAGESRRPALYVFYRGDW